MPLSVPAACDDQPAGPSAPPPGAVVITPDVQNSLAEMTRNSPAGTTFWLAPGVHTLGSDQYDQVQPKDGNSYVGGPGAILDGKERNLYAFTGYAQDVTITGLTVRGFISPVDQGVVNHDSGSGWVVQNNILEKNKGAALMTGPRSVVRHNCLRDNGQYGINGFGSELVVEGNEITGNNTDDLEHTIDGGCGCTGGTKFWEVNKADIRDNWVHDNHGAGLWMDTNNNDFLIENNVIENNDAEAIFYEISYNLVLRGNVIRNNGYVKGKEFAANDDAFPVGAVYLSEAGGDPRVPSRTGKIEIYDNVLENNWSGIVAWENADRFCNSPANTSTGYCTRLVPSTEMCSAPAIEDEPRLGDCRWKTQRLDIHHNTFITDPDVVSCATGATGAMALIANYGTYPEWSPYKGDAVQRAITFEQQNTWRDNTYRGPWRFMSGEVGPGAGPDVWQSDPYHQDAGSTFDTRAGC